MDRDTTALEIEVPAAPPPTVTVTIAYDLDEQRPGCVLIQAAMGASISSDALIAFPTESWLLAPTPAMRLFEVTPHQLDILQRRAHRVYPPR